MNKTHLILLSFFICFIHAAAASRGTKKRNAASPKQEKPETKKAKTIKPSNTPKKSNAEIIEAQRKIIEGYRKDYSRLYAWVRGAHEQYETKYDALVVENGQLKEKNRKLEHALLFQLNPKDLPPFPQFETPDDAGFFDSLS